MVNEEIADNFSDLFDRIHEFYCYTQRHFHGRAQLVSVDHQQSLPVNHVVDEVFFKSMSISLGHKQCHIRDAPLVDIFFRQFGDHMVSQID